MPSTLSHLSAYLVSYYKKTPLAGSDQTFLNVTFLRKTWRKCISNCSTANLLCKQFRTRWWRGSCSISSLKGKIMERFKELLEINAGETLKMILAWCTSPQKRTVT